MQKDHKTAETHDWTKKFHCATGRWPKQDENNQKRRPTGIGACTYILQCIHFIPTRHNLSKIEEVLKFDCQTIYNYFNRWYLESNTTKTVTNFFHVNNHEADKTLNIKINDLKLPNDKTPKYLGVYSDRTLTYRKHVEESTNKLKKRTSLIRKPTGTTWGASPSVRKISALAQYYSVAEYCAPVWGRSLHTAKINIQPRQAMRIITGTLKSTPLPWLSNFPWQAPLRHHTLKENWQLRDGKVG